MDEGMILAEGLGRTLSEAVTALQRANSSGLARETWTVSAVNSDGTCDLYRGGTADDPALSMEGVPYTTACIGIAAGSRVLLDTVAHVPAVTGVLAGSSPKPAFVKKAFQMSVSTSGVSSATIPCSVPDGYEWLCYCNPQTVGFVSYIYVNNDGSSATGAQVWYGGGSGIVRVNGIYVLNGLI